MTTPKKPTKKKKVTTVTTTTTTTTTIEDMEDTHITIVMDRSGSMASISHEMERQINAFLQEQRAFKGRCTVSVILFDDQIEILHNNVDIADVPRLVINPRGWTALNDATMRGIQLADSSKAAKQVFVVVTDGEENRSREFPRSAPVRDAIKKRDTWAFMFFGTESAFAQAEAYGVPKGNVMSYNASEMGVASAGRVLRSATSNYRKGLASNQALFADPKDLK